MLAMLLPSCTLAASQKFVVLLPPYIFFSNYNILSRKFFFFFCALAVAIFSFLPCHSVDSHSTTFPPNAPLFSSLDVALLSTLGLLLFFF